MNVSAPDVLAGLGHGAAVGFARRTKRLCCLKGHHSSEDRSYPPPSSYLFISLILSRPSHLFSYRVVWTSPNLPCW